MIPFLPALPTALAAPEPCAAVLEAPPATPDEIDDILEELHGAMPGCDGIDVRVRSRDGALRPLADFRPDVSPPPGKPGEEAAGGRVPRDMGGMPASAPGRAEGALSGKEVYLSQSHGWLWYDSLWDFSLQRPVLHSTVEDFHNAEAIDQFLAQYLENAGAEVFTVRERDLNPLWSVADAELGGYEEEGEGFVDDGAGWGGEGPWAYGDNPFEAGGARAFPADGGAVARWTPEVPADGLYAVYVSYRSGSDRAPDAHYRIVHPGGTIDRVLDQRVHGSTWRYLDTLWLPAGVGGLVVELVGDSSCSGCTLSADAVRIGGGVGFVERHGGTTGRPRWEEGAVLSVQGLGAPESVYDPYDDGNGSDPSSRSRWAAWEHPSGVDAVYVSWHTNAGGGRGTSTYTYDGSSYPRVEGSEELGDLLQEEIVDAMRLLWDSGWTDRGHLHEAFSEVNPGHNDEMPAALVELAFHDDATDAAFIKDPAFRRDAARAMMRAVIRYFAERDGVAAHFPPEPPVDVSVVHGDDGRLVASWAPGPSGDPWGDPPDRYLVQTSEDGRAWDEGEEVDGTSLVLDAAPGELVFVRVVALNEGGRSFPSEVVGARRSPDGTAPVLLVGAFDRFEGSLLPVVEVEGQGDVVRMDLPRVNPRDQVATVGRAIADAGWYFDSASDEAFDEMDLAPYRLVVWLAGEESTHDDSFSAEQEATLRAFVEGGGALLASGAEILWDLDEYGDADDQAFCDDVLGARMAADDAGTTTATGAGPLDGVDLSFGVEDDGFDGQARGGGAPYPVEYPDVLAAQGEALALYPDGGVAAAAGPGGALFGFPIECIGDEGARIELMARLLPLLVPGYEPPEVPDTGGAGDTGGADTGGAGGPGAWERPGGGCGCAAGGHGGGATGTAALALALGLVAGRRRTGGCAERGRR